MYADVEACGDLCMWIHKYKHCSICTSLSPSNIYSNLKDVLHAGCRFVLWKVKIWNFFLKIQETISRTTSPMLGLFVCILIHFSCWLQVTNENLNFKKILKKVWKFWPVVCTRHPCEKGEHSKILFGWNMLFRLKTILINTSLQKDFLMLGLSYYWISGSQKDSFLF